MHHTTPHHTTPHYSARRYTNYNYSYNYNYATVHYITLDYTTLPYIALHYTTAIKPPQLQLELHCINYTTPQLQLHYTTTLAPQPTHTSGSPQVAQDSWGILVPEFWLNPHNILCFWNKVAYGEV